MNPAFLDDMSWEMAEVYGAISDQILINLAHYFPYFNANNLPASSFAYQAGMLAQMGKVNADTAKIIRNGLADADSALNGVLEAAIIQSIQAVEPDLYKAARLGILKPPVTPILSPNQTRAFQLYYKQAADKLNLVNTVMLESTLQAYQTTVSDITSRVQYLQRAVDIGAGETITGVSSWNQAMSHAINRMKQTGITGFIDHAGKRWSAEAYTAMDIRTTVFNVGRSAVWEVNQDFGNDLYLVSYHNGARPLCYPWQSKVISSTDHARTVVDLDGNEITVYAQSETSYGEPAGLFGINCKHYPTPFIPGVSTIHDHQQTPEANEKTYEESQKQRQLERTLREEKRDLAMLKAQGAPKEVIDAQKARCERADERIEDFCLETGRARHRDREAVYTKRAFPSKDSYDPATFEREQKEWIDDYYKRHGEQRRFVFDEMKMKGAPPVANVAQQGTQNAPQRATINYGKPFDDSGYRKPQKQQIAKARATLDNAPDEARNVWSKVADKLERPQLDRSCDGAYYSPRDKCTHYKTWKKCFEESTYQRENAVFYHEYGHNIDNILGGGGWQHDRYFSTQYVGKNGKRFAEVLEEEIGDTLGAYYLKKNGFTDYYDVVKAQQDGPGGMGFLHYARQMLKGTMPRDEWQSIRGTLYADNIGDDVLRPLVDKWLRPQFKHDVMMAVHADAKTGQAFCDWVKSTYSIYETTDVSDAFGNYMTRNYKRGFSHPFGVGHDSSYQMVASNLPIETFAEFYSATVTQSDSMKGIRDFLPKSYEFFMEMLGDAAHD